MSSYSSSQVADSWISAFCNLMGHEYFAEVSEDFIEDDFNLTGLQSQVPMYKEALEMILDVEPEDDDDDEEEEEDEDEDGDEPVGAEGSLGYRRAGERRNIRMASDLSVIETSAELLYGLIHQRYITSRPGIQQMGEKYDLQHFGTCPRVFCNGCKVLPVGCSDIPGQETVKLFCPSCLDIYTPPNSRFQNVDGAFFGTTFGCLFFMTFPELDIGNRSSEAAAALAQQQGLQITDGGVVEEKSNQSSSNGQPQPTPTPAVVNGITTTNLAPGLGRGNMYEPRIYGFRVSERAKSGPRMKWLRSRPADVHALDEARRFFEENGAEEPTLLDEGEEEDEEDMDAVEDGGVVQDQVMPDQDQSQTLSIERRKKAPMRRRREPYAVNGTGASGSPMDTNGTGNGG
ncbi:MAG: casein kinase 2 regulatory subunit [Bathelium mastoideum]|nr:MAG: casein kinase 2 regulatory subunit [Bathelium mastoideum]KAI9691826.1 MAG: casein kinase 2 regulatory subunit [Bathelium mastoideum]